MASTRAYVTHLSIERTHKFFPCVGALVAPNMVLFSANCFNSSTIGMSPNEAISVASTYPNKSGYDEWIPIVQRHYHPKLDEMNQEYDVVVVKLKTPSRYPPVKIHWGDMDPGINVGVNGWILSQPERPAFQPNMTLLDNKDCQERMNDAAPPSFTICDSIQCAWNSDNAKCAEYTSGPREEVLLNGPLVVVLNGKDHLIGISLAPGHCSPLPYMYTRLSTMRDFIEPFVSGI
ncbi:hypothetical protein H257_12648 [Aphanomyces astaci]|uniref:Peptidase S1 domain-containing protein n=1 Tax=Aphanomyces astaci TaxID=112090 RepID=W4FXF3_APHAT|nr:hypothetical protein H257_12648 [Aphanomyces astaci]ETV72172.1 hypothetical protein H257_12648 [Aphanomyces astaci]|eukprot:XP_009838240.1 hypothetical protein H257_12648 [Aphanomyces astaci]